MPDHHQTTRDFLWIEGEPPRPGRYIGQDDRGEYRMEWTEESGGWWVEIGAWRPRTPKRWRPMP